MKKESPFRIQPVRRYKRARYASESGESLIGRAMWLSYFFPRKVVNGAVTLLLLGGLALGAHGCFAEDNISMDPPGEQCAEDGLVSCVDDSSVWVCLGGEKTETDCRDVCLERYGEEAPVHFLASCNPEEDLLCTCEEYTIPDGDIADCNPGDVFCADETYTAYVCNETGEDYDVVNCNEYCSEAYGWDYYSEGCNAETPDNFCSCEYGQIEGIMVECYPGDLWCEDTETLRVCGEDFYSTPISCYDYCQQEYGVEYYSLGCNDENVENICNCEYGQTPGIMVECNPGDIYCENEETLKVCTDNYYYESINCDEYCLEEYGEFYLSGGCDAEAEDPCQCYGAIAGEPVECYVGEEGCIHGTDLTRCAPYDDSDPEEHQGEPGHMETISCDQFCMETYGSEYYSPLGCQADDPDGNGELCNCEYGVIDGDIAGECFPGDVYCDPDGNAVVCEEMVDYYGFWVTKDCEDLCRSIDPESGSEGCDASQPDNYCLCSGDDDDE